MIFFLNALAHWLYPFKYDIFIFQLLIAFLLL